MIMYLNTLIHNLNDGKHNYISYCLIPLLWFELFVESLSTSSLEPTNKNMIKVPKILSKLNLQLNIPSLFFILRLKYINAWYTILKHLSYFLCVHSCKYYSLLCNFIYPYDVIFLREIIREGGRSILKIKW